ILANKRRAAVGEIAYCKRRELRAPLDFGRLSCFRDQCSVRGKELRVGGAAIGSGVQRVRGTRDELLDLDGVARRERTHGCSGGGGSGNLRGWCGGRRRRRLRLRSRARRKEPARLDTPAFPRLHVCVFVMAAKEQRACLTVLAVVDDGEILLAFRAAGHG